MPDEPDNKSEIKSGLKKPQPLNPESSPKTSKTLKSSPEPVKVEETALKKKAAKKAKYEELPEIPDYERPELEVYDPNDFDPTVREREGLSFPEREKEQPEVSERRRSSVKAKKEELAKIEDYEKPKLEKYEKTPFQPAKKEEVEAPKSSIDVKPNTAIARAMELAGIRRKSSVKVEDVPDQNRLLKASGGGLRGKPSEEEGKPTELEPTPRKSSLKSDKTLFDAPKKQKYDPLPEIPDYDRPDLETYEESDFDPTKKEKADAPMPASKAKEEEPKKKSMLKPNAKSSIDPTNEDFGEINMSTPKAPIKKTSTEAEAAEAKFKQPATLKPPTVVEEAASKSIVIKEPVEEAPIEIMITDSEGSSKNSDQAAADEAKKRAKRTKYDPMAYIPDDDDETPAPAPAEPETPKPSPSRAKYDPLKYTPDKELPTVEEVNKNTKLNLHNQTQTMKTIRDTDLELFAEMEKLAVKALSESVSTRCLSLNNKRTHTHTICKLFINNQRHFE